MILEDIRKAIISLLRDHTGVEHITGEEVLQAKDYSGVDQDGSELVMPLLQLQLMPLNFHTAAAGFFTDKKVLVDISYMEEVTTSNRSIYAMLEKLDSILRPVLKIGDRQFTINADTNITDGIGHYTFILSFTDINPKEPEEPVAENLYLNMEEESNGIT